MAENPIRKEDIIDGDAIQKEIVETTDALAKLIDEMQHLTIVAAASKKAQLEGMDPATKEGRKAIRENSKDINDLIKTHTELIRSQDRLKRAREQAAKSAVAEKGSYNDLAAELRRLKQDFKNTADEGIQRGMLPKIGELDKKLKSLDATLGVHNRNVGNYGKAILDAGKQMLTMGGIAGVLMAAVTKLKEAFMETTHGLNLMNIAGEVSKQLFYDLSNLTFNPTRMLQAEAMAKRANEIREDDILDLMRIARMEKEMQLLRFKSVDATKGQAAMLENLNKFQEKENELIEFKLKDRQEELDLELDWLEIRPRSEKHLKRTAQLYAEIQAIQGERSLRVESRRIAVETANQKKQEDWQNKLKAWHEEIEQGNIDRLEQAKKIETDRVNAVTAIREREFAKLTEENANKVLSIQLSSDQTVNAKLKEIELIKAAESDLAEFQEELAQEVKDDKVATFLEEANKYIEIASIINTGLSDALEQRKQKELSAVGDNAEAREKIEKEYANKQKAFAISEAIINGASAIVRQFADLPFVAALITSALTAATTATQIGIISSQKFAEGGYTGDGTSRDSTGERVAGVVHEKEYVIPKEPTRKYRALLEAIHADNPMAIAEELKNRQFHMVWGGVQPKISEAHRQDPYTQLMYNLMKNSVTTYQDSNGDTVLRYADGTTRIVRGKA